MKALGTFLLLSLILLRSSSALAEQIKIVKINGNIVTLEAPAGELQKGQQVNFLGSDMTIKATGIVDNISPQGKMATVKVSTGTVQKDFVPESAGDVKIENKTESKKTPVQLTKEEQEILDRGEIGTTAYVLGGVLGTYPLGLGIGHAIQGRYSEKGWIFTVGELGSAVIFLAGFHDCAYSLSLLSSSGCSTNGLMTLGVVAFVGFRIWEIVDLWATPPEINRRYRALKERTGHASLSPVLAPVSDGLLLGLKYDF